MYNWQSCCVMVTGSRSILPTRRGKPDLIRFEAVLVGLTEDHGFPYTSAPKTNVTHHANGFYPVHP